MKKVLIIIAMGLMLVSCANKNNVNILISNNHRADTTNVMVKVPVDEILQHLDAQNVDSLVLLNEKNQQVQYVVSYDKKDVEFVVPVVKARSQKNYSLNTGNTQLSDNLFSFRTTSINITL